MTPLRLPLLPRRDVALVPVPAEVADVDAVVERLISAGQFGVGRTRPRIVSLADAAAYREASMIFQHLAAANGAKATWVVDASAATVGVRAEDGAEAVFALRLVALMLD